MLGLLNLFWTAVLLIVSGAFTMGIVPAVYFIYIFFGRVSRVDKAKAKLRSNLMKQEEIVGITVQKRALSTLKRRTLVCITNSRIIVMYRKILGGYKTLDFQWKDLVDVTVIESIFPGLFGSNLRFEYAFEKQKKEGEKNHIVLHHGFDSSEATKIYAYAQDQEQAWQEKRRVRDMEEKRAVAGGIQIGGFPMPQAAAPAGSAFVGELIKAKQLLDTGLISDVEFQEIKSKLLSQSY